MERKYCYCVSYNGYSDCPGESCFIIEKVFYGPDAKDKAINLAIKLNIEYLQDICGDDDPECTKILTNEEKSPEDNLKTYIRTLDYSHGNMKYEETFYDYNRCEIEI